MNMKTDWNHAEVRTRSVPAAAHLLCAGFKPLGVKANFDSSKTIRFPGEARAAMDAFLAAKDTIDAMLDSTQ